MSKIVQNNAGKGGIGVPGLLGVAFIVLKLMGHIDWSWFWVLSPFWVGLVVWLVVFFTFIALSVVNNRRN